MAHTPGPWEIGFGGIPVATALEKSARTYVLQQESDDGVGEMAFISSWRKDPSDAKEAEANARLIAAAPELLEALEALVSILDPYDYPDEQNPARAAIAKAKGLNPDQG